MTEKFICLCEVYVIQNFCRFGITNQIRPHQPSFSLLELNDFVLQLDEEVEGMESTICALQQQLKETKQKHQDSIEENNKLKTTLESAHKLDSKRSYDISIDKDIDMDAKRARNFFEVIDGPRYDEPGFDEDDEMNLRTKMHTGEQGKSKTKSPGKASNSNAYSISNLLSSDAKEEDDASDDDIIRTRKTHGHGGTNGEVSDSDSNMSS